MKKSLAKGLVSEDRRYPIRPFVGVGVVVWREDKILLVKRGRAPRLGEWGLPGGAQKVGETLFAAAIREVREETGLEISPFAIITAIDALSYDKSKEVEYHYTIVEVAADASPGKAAALDDATDVKWVALDEIDALCAWPEVARVARLSLLEKLL